MRAVGTNKPEEIFAQLQQKCPEAFVAAAAEATKGPEPVTVASAGKAYAEATKVFKELVSKREQLAARFAAQTKQVAQTQAELEDTTAKLAEANVAQATCATALQQAGTDHSDEAKQSGASQRGGHEEALAEDDDFDMEGPSLEAAEALSKLQEVLGPDNKLLDGFDLVRTKRRRRDLAGATAAEAMAAGAAAAALVEAAAVIAKGIADKAAAAEKAKEQKG
jgi:hypothetical protein